MTDAAIGVQLVPLDITLAQLSAFVQVVLVDLVLAGDNAIVVGVAVAGLPIQQRARVMVIGIGAATVMRILFASITVQLLQIIGLLLAGGLLLLWVSWKLWRELREMRREHLRAGQAARDGALASTEHDATPVHKTKSMRDAITQIVIADVSMSLDNVLAVAGVAREHAWVLVFGLALSVAFMGFAAVIIARLLDRYHWIAYFGLAVIFYVALRMIWDGAWEVAGAAA
ncbi:MAG TPA: YjbE family putative metal transport protein [Gammaproteobacteria bacterium]